MHPLYHRHGTGAVDMVTFSDSRHPLAADGNRSSEEWHHAMKSVRRHVAQALHYVRTVYDTTTDEQLAAALGCNTKTLSALQKSPETCMKGAIDKLCKAAHTNIAFLQHGGGFYESCDLWDGETVRGMYETADEETQREVTAILKRHHLAKWRDMQLEITRCELQKRM